MSVTLTTIDNPFHPFNEFQQWLKFDKLHCYNSSELLDRFVRTSEALSDADQELAYEEAVDHIVNSEWLNPLGVYIKFKSNPPSTGSDTPTVTEKDLPPSNNTNKVLNSNKNDSEDSNYYSEEFYKEFLEERDLLRSQNESF